jgi:hypothetical protein
VKIIITAAIQYRITEISAIDQCATYVGFWVAFTLIFSAIAVDNYAIMYQGISANCITPAYSVLPLTYYGIFWVGKHIST